ncbi:MAG TPA: hypothetical protein VM802_04560 [Chitinophaga sp.]|uniref:hypothetical protein n=1 Tax=Chitinophaga sp. TaxID=1869181 RepID=UPI002BA408A3|nr:hypothetical protein [Chitinophaga sp.]HVI44111.1 hypothetical protein [Chitinophaga sp.]
MIACNGGNQKDSSKQTDFSIVKTDTTQPITATADTAAVSTETYVAGIISRRQAIASQLPGLNAEKAAQLYQSLASYVDSVLGDIADRETVWLDQYANYSSEAEAPAKVQQRVKLLATAGLEPWGIGEGYSILRTVPDFYTGLFKNSLPADHNKYLQLKADEDTVLYSADAGLVIPFNLIGKRALNWEKFLDTYPGSTFFISARELFEGYCTDYLFGEDNTPSFDNESLNSLLPENKEEYLSFIQQHGDTKTGNIVKQFMSRLGTEKNNDSLRLHMRTTIESAYPSKK